MNHIAIVKVNKGKFMTIDQSKTRCMYVFDHQEVVEQHYKNRRQTSVHMLKYTEEEWLATETMLTQERGLWGPFNESPLTKWMMDLTEGPSRMRQRLIRNDMFYLHYPFRYLLFLKSQNKYCYF